jgi:cysteine desulfurase
MTGAVDAGEGGPLRVAYLDHAATAPVRPEVAEATAPFLHGCFGNPSGSHRVARAARLALEEARDEVAALLGANPDEVVFTGGGTEGANLAVLGPLAAMPGATAVVHSAVEHPAVAEACRAAEGGKVPALRPVCRLVAPVDRYGAVEPAALAALLGQARADGVSVGVVSVMTANHEVGTVQPLAEVAEVVRRHAPEAVLHSDAVQAASWLDLAVVAACADLVSVSGHKVGGPRGSGALVVRRGVPLAPLTFGGGQEHERRSGTHDVAAAVGLAVALRLADASRGATSVRVGALRDRLAAGLLAAVPGAVRSVPGDRSLPGHCHLCIPGVDREELLVLVDQGGVCASAGAACASGALEPSPVLAAMGVPAAHARGALRLTLGAGTSDADVDQALAVVPAAVARLRDGV